MEFLNSFARLRPALRELMERAMTEPPMNAPALHQFLASDYGVAVEELKYVAEHVAAQEGYEVHHCTDGSCMYVRYVGRATPSWNDARPDEEMRQQARDLLAQYGRSHN